MRNRILLDSAYDFFVIDGRDGEIRGPFDTSEDAKREAKKWRKTLDKCMRCCIYVDWKVNERKIKMMFEKGKIR